MVEKFKQILREMEKEKGPVTLFAILKMDEITDKWTVVLSAPWIRENNFDSFEYVFKLLKKILTNEEDNAIARIGIFEKEHHLITELLKFKKDSIIQDQRVNGNKVHFAHIFESNNTR